MENKNCIICNKTFTKPASCGMPEWRNRRKYCSRKCKGIAQKTLYKGKLNPCYRGGRTITALGYVEILIPEHPNANNRGYVYEHRLVMEQKLGRFLKPKEIVHHINKNRQDNNPENLKVFSSIGQHLKHELTGKSRPPHFAKFMKAYWAKKRSCHDVGS